MMPGGSLVLRVPVPQFANYMQSVFLIEDQPSPWSWILLTNDEFYPVGELVFLGKLEMETRCD